jgi:hypothetical protein
MYIKRKMESLEENKKIAMRKYQRDFYENHKERLKDDKLVSYYKREYGLNFLTRDKIKAFRENKNIYLALLDANGDLDADIIRSIYDMKYANQQTHQ